MTYEDIKKVALIYLQQQDLSQLSPEQAYQKYVEYYTAMQQVASSPAPH